VTPAWVPVAADPPAVLYRGDIWLVCPVKGFDCGRVRRDPFGQQWAMDVMSVHCGLYHQTWK
jgi:hypothetical protein